MSGHVVTSPPEPFAVRHLVVHVVPAATDNLVWLLVDHARGEAAAVDGPDARTVLAACAALGVRLTTILTTHTHGDHVGLHHGLRSDGLLGGVRVIGSAATASDIPGLTDPVVDGDVVDVFGVPFRVMRTDGHLTGHVCYVTDGAVFCGDTMFGGGCGYVFDGPMDAMFQSLLRLAGLPGATRVCCAHEYTEDNLRFAWLLEPDNHALADRVARVWAVRAAGGCSVPSTIEEERATNPFLRPGAPRLVRSLSDRGLVADPTDALAVFTAARLFKNQGPHKELADPLDAARALLAS
jgi:hydroxyacylglutathione hydrolase